MGSQYITEILHFHDKQFRRHRIDHTRQITTCLMPIAQKKSPDSPLLESPESTRMSLQPQSTHRLFNDIDGQWDVAILEYHALASL